jgi:hypothetical protein
MTQLFQNQTAATATLALVQYGIRGCPKSLTSRRIFNTSYSLTYRYNEILVH